MDKVVFGNKLKELRSQKHTQIELGKLIGVGDKQIQRYENGEALPSHENLETLCKLYKYDFVSLVYDIPKDAAITPADKDKTILNLSEANITLSKATLILAEKINSGEPALASLPSEEAGNKKRHGVEKVGSLDKQEIRSNERKSKKTGISV